MNPAVDSLPGVRGLAVAVLAPVVALDPALHLHRLPHQNRERRRGQPPQASDPS